MKKSIAWMQEHFTEETGEKALKLAAKLIRCAPENPPGSEEKAAETAASVLEEAGFTVELDEFEPGRLNVIATYGNREDLALILNGHLDVVPAFGEWERDPAEGQRGNGLLYGRGSCDMLGGCAAIVTAAALAAKGLKHTRRGIMVLLVGDEEEKNKGIRHILDTRKLKADCAVIAEPTECQIQLGNRGFSSYYIETRGIACHASEPWNGINAIYKMGEIIRRYERYAASLSNVRASCLGQATACIGTIHGGIKLNTVPDRCVIEAERRLLPGETEEKVREEIRNAVGDDGIVSLKSFFPASLIDEEHPLVERCRQGLKAVQGKEPVISVFRACTEASMFSVYCEIPTLILGPGSLDQAHRVNEFCREQDIVDCAKVYTALIYKALEVQE